MTKSFIPILIIASLIGCQKAAQQSDVPPQKITVSYTTQPQSTLIHVALANGYFVEEGLDVQTIVNTFGKASLQTLLEHKSDFASVAETPVMFSILKGEKIFVIANVETTNMNNAILARVDAGIVKSADLKGKRIGYTPGTTSDFFLDSILTANNLSRKQIQAIPLKPEEMQDAIMAKQVDAVCTWNYPLVQIKHLLGANGTIIYDKEIYTETYNVAAQQEYVKNNPETVQRFLRALIKAENFVVKNPDAAQSIVSSATKVDKNLVREVWDAFNYHVTQNNSLLITLEDETRWAMENKLTPQKVMPNYQDYLYLDGLRAVKPEAVKVN